ncbi:CYTH domain protein [Phycisphaerae bacterium RAS1]|nr:CYTH domain protein [Phycisphaerae bacterium RAS1]
MHETEAKYRLDDPGSLRRRLAELAARPLSWVAERNELFDTDAGRLRAAGCGLRLRIARPLDSVGEQVATLTFKGPRQPAPDAAALKRREEIEFLVSDPDAARTLLRRLGFAPTIIYEKRRESWLLRGCCITLDELPRCGWFVEIEAPHTTEAESGSGASAIAAAAAGLGLGPASALAETYVDMAAARGDPNVIGGFRELLWPS